MKVFGCAVLLLWVATVSAGPLHSWSKILPEPRFQFVMNDEAVFDRETGLVWEQSPGTTSLDYPDDYSAGIGPIFTCYNKVVGGRKGWRLPTVEELASLIDPAESSPALPNGHPFSHVQNAYYLSILNGDHEEGNKFYRVSFDTGAVQQNLSSGQYLWCVRGGHGGTW